MDGWRLAACGCGCGCAMRRELMTAWALHCTGLMESTFIILFSIASLVAFAVRRTPIPYTVALVVVGLAAGQLELVSPPALTKELLFALFLPGLVFEAAYNIHVSELRSSWKTIATLAVP